ncbi:MAG: glutathione synthase [Gammaproteobacteria bacterium]|nr:MAG: glutathione synthase [Gammaproteobacteria bacterium]
MNRRLGIVMDPIQDIKIHKDSSFAMLLEAQARGWELYYMEMSDLRLDTGNVLAKTRSLEVQDNRDNWFKLDHAAEINLNTLDVILMRKDPPFDMEYIYSTYLLELVSEQGVLVVNQPDSLRDCNEKLFTAWFPQCCAPTLVSRNHADFISFLQLHKSIVVKPLDGMGGRSIFTVRENDENRNVILETMTLHEQRFAMAQKFIPEISQGDKRILLIDGHPVPYALARIPTATDSRGNLAAGARAEGVELSERDHWICKQVGPALRERGLVFVGLDVIGDWLTEINVTSPTCIRELDAIYDLNISAELFDVIDNKIQA